MLFDAPVRAAAPELARLDKLTYDYMNGIQFFLNRSPARRSEVTSRSSRVPGR